VRYAVNGGASLAYQVFGDGPSEVVLVTGWVLPMELFWDEPGFAAFLERLAATARVLIWDKRGTGLSDRISRSELPTLEERMGDLRAVMDAAGFDRSTIIGLSEGGHLGILLAAAHPERVRALGIYGGWACSMRQPDYPWGATKEEDEKLFGLVERYWGGRRAPAALLGARVRERPGAAHLVGARAAPRRDAHGRAAVAGDAPDVDLRAVLPSIRVPTVIVHREGDAIIPCRQRPLPRRRHPGCPLRRAAGRRSPVVGGRPRRRARPTRRAALRRRRRGAARAGAWPRSCARAKPPSRRCVRRSSATAAGCSPPTWRRSTGRAAPCAAARR
jgi:pimeloyl-ACP methyl ester carboxylesterase